MSITISLQFPTGRYVAAAWHDKESVEWPPHPARLCLGLIDALHRAGNPEDERNALLWLCEQGAPTVVIPEKSQIDEKVFKGIYVPQNVQKDSLDHPRKERAFPMVFLDPDQPSVFFRWEQAEMPPDMRASLTRLLRRLPRLGHSSSMMIATLGLDIDPANKWTILEPVGKDSIAGTPDHLLRVPWDGLVEAAEVAFDAAGRSDERTLLIEKASRTGRAQRPPASPRQRHDPSHRWTGYIESCASSEIRGPWNQGILILQQDSGDRLGIESTWQITEIMHKTLLDRWSRDPSLGPVPTWISGHAPNSTDPAKMCHLAIFPLPFVGRDYADGHLLGLGIALPDPKKLDLEPIKFRLQWKKALGLLLDQNGGVQLVPGDKSWSATFSPLSSPEPKLALRPHRWTHPSRRWKSATPVILHIHPKPHFKKDPQLWRESCRKIIVKCCEQLGLPAPIREEPSLSSALQGVPSAASFVAPRSRSSRPPRFHLHAEIEFPEPVTGPLLLGAGRYRGYGLFVPVDEKNHATSHETA